MDVSTLPLVRTYVSRIRRDIKACERRTRNQMWREHSFAPLAKPSSEAVRRRVRRDLEALGRSWPRILDIFLAAWSEGSESDPESHRVVVHVDGATTGCFEMSRLECTAFGVMHRASSEPDIEAVVRSILPRSWAIYHRIMKRANLRKRVPRRPVFSEHQRW